MDQPWARCDTSSAEAASSPERAAAVVVKAQRAPKAAAATKATAPKIPPKGPKAPTVTPQATVAASRPGSTGMAEAKAKAAASQATRDETSSEEASSPERVAGPRATSTAEAKAKAKSKAKAKAKAKVKAKAKAVAQVRRATAASARATCQAKAEAKAAALSASRDQTSRDETSSDDASDDEAKVVHAPGDLRPQPLSSGVFDYVRWAVEHVLTSEEQIRMAAPGSPGPLTFGSMCAGMGTEEIALHAIKQELLRHGHVLRTTCLFRAEKDVAKVTFLKRRLPCQEAKYFQDNRDLRKACPKDMDGQTGPRPVVDFLVCGIVCKDISQLNNRPQSERSAGASGTSLEGLLAYVKALTFEQRPKVVVLECVQRLGQRRAVDPDARTGTQYIADQLASQGYVGQWEKVSPTSFFLPQSRPRVYGLFLRVHALGQAGVAQREQDLAAAMRLLGRLQVPHRHEALCEVLNRCERTPQPPATSKRSRPTPDQSAADHATKVELTKPKADDATKAELTKPKADDAPEAEFPKPKADTEAELTKTKHAKWRGQNEKWARAKGLTAADRRGIEDFRGAMASILLEREVEALWLKLCWLKKAKDFDWRHGEVVATVGASISFMSIRRGVFPCVTPGMAYVILRNGTPKGVDAMTLLAMQGVQCKEVEQFGFHREREPLLRNLSGNAFTANIVAAFLLVGLFSLALPDL